MAEDSEDSNIGSFYMGRVRPPPEPKRFLPPGVLTLIALAVMGGIVWYAYPRGTRNADVPVIKANTAPIKSAPANPGGMKIPYQQSTAFNPLTKGGDQTVEKLTPPPVQPMDKAAAIKALQAKMAAPAKLDMQVKQVGHGVEELVPPPPVARPPVTVATITPRKAESPEIKFSAQEEASAHKALPAPKEIVKQATVRKSVSHGAAMKDKTTAPAGAKEFEVQLGSYRARADAKAYWDHMRPRFSALRHMEMRIVRADIPGRGVYYRLQAGPVSKDKGDAICKTVKAARRPCILARR